MPDSLQSTPDPRLSTPNRRLPTVDCRLEWGARVAIVTAVVLASYWRIVDSETYMRLAIGRFVAGGGLGKADPFLYSLPGLRWRNPEWLGDLLLYGTWRAGGETALVLLKMVVTASGWLLLYQLARRRGGSPAVIVALAMVVLGGSEWHMSERNEMHLHWLVPAYGLVLDSARRDRRRLWALLPLGTLWANLHGSFTFSWLLVGAALAEALLGEDRDRKLARALALILAVHPLLAFVSPEGWRVYAFVLDHWRHRHDIKRLIREWQPPDREAASVAQASLHVLGLLGLASFLPRPNRRQVGGFLLFAAGAVMAYGAQRFMVLFGLLSLPVVAGNLDRLRPFLRPAAARSALVVLLLIGGALEAPAALAARRVPHAALQRGYPAHAAAWIAGHAPSGSRLFMPYTGSQWLMWLAPQVPLYIHPQLSYGSEHLVRFFDEILPHPERFEEEVRRFDINLALVDLVGESNALYAHLDAARDWTPVYFDGFYALYARRTPANQALIEQSGFRVLKAHLGFDYLARVPDEQLAPDLERLDREAAALAGALRAFRLLRTAPSREAGQRAGEMLRASLNQLPRAPAFFAYLVEAHVLAGDPAAARATLAHGLAVFPRSTRLQAIAAELPPAR
jgi:hypothetical protein